jgi:CSLREA domain-containing protein
MSVATITRRRGVVALAALATALAGLTAAPPAHAAASFVVDSTADASDAVPGDGTCATAADACTLRAAFEEADALDDAAITIQVPAGTYLLTAGEISLSDAAKSADTSYTVEAIGGRAVIDAGGNSRVVGIYDTDDSEPGPRLDVVLRGLGITGGSVVDADGAGLYVWGDAYADPRTSVLLDDVHVTDNELLSGWGGGIANYGADLELRDSLVADNLATDGQAGPGEGGGIYTGVAVQQASVLTLVDTDVLRNEASEGGGIWAGPGDTVTVSGGSFVDNRAVPQQMNSTFNDHSGGAVYGDLSVIEVGGTHFEGNVAAAGGGAIFTGSQAYLLAGDETFAPTAAREPAAVETQNGAVGSTVTITDSTFVANGQLLGGTDTFPFDVTTRMGGAIQTRWGDVVTIADSLFEGNLARFVGGAVETGGATTVITGTHFADNHVTCDGGMQPSAQQVVEPCEAGGGALSSMAMYATQTLYVAGSSFVGNSGAYGGALLNFDLAYVTNSTFTDNHAWVGGAIYNSGELHLARTTIAHNAASDPDSAGGLVEDAGAPGTTYLDHALFAGNTADGTLRNCVEDSGAIVTEGHNVSDDDSCFTDGEATGDQADVDVMLGDTATDGATTFLPLLPGSPAIDVDAATASCPTATDDADTDVHADEASRDQRGAPAPVDGDADGTVGCDAGAFEFQTNVVSVSATTDGAEAGPVHGSVTFTRTGDLHAPLTVTITVSGTATAGSDYTTLPTTVTFAGGAATATLPVTVIDDTAVEDTETVVVTIAPGTGYLVGTPASGTVEIADDDVTRAPRFAGEDRIETAVLTSQFSFPDGADTVVIARSDVYADALAGGPLAYELEAPILVTPTDVLDERVAAEIDRLGASEAVILGGTAAIAMNVEDAVRTTLDLDTRRLAGLTRYHTAVAIATELGGDRVYITEGANADPARGWPDAVSVSSLAAFQGHPILFVLADDLPQPTRAHLAAHVSTATIVGGRVAVSSRIADEIDGLVGVVDRIAGPDRYATGLAIADASVAAGLTPDTLWVARGDNWVDALVAGPAVARAGDVFLLVPPTDLANAPAVQSWIAARADVIDMVRIMGGEQAVSAVVEQQLLTLID